MSKVIPMNIEAGELPEHPLVDFGRVFVRRLDDGLHGIPEVKSMLSITDFRERWLDNQRRIAAERSDELDAAMFRELVNPTPDELRDRWSRMNMHEGGIEWDGPLPNWTPGLKVTEEE